MSTEYPGFPVYDGVTTIIPVPENVTDPNFANPTQQYVLHHYLIFGIGGPLAFIALIQRYYTKIFLSKGLQVDDAFMFLGWAASVVTQAMLTHSIVIGGMCAHAWEMPISRFASYSLTTYITAPVFMLCNGFTKLSLLAFYLHLSHLTWFRVAVWSSIALVSVYTAAITLAMFFQCRPVEAAYDFTVPQEDKTCLDAGALYMATAGSNIVTDVILFCLPIPMVLGLRMGVAQKVGAIVIFAIGSVTVATSVVRLTLLPATLASTDPSWDAAPANVWTFLEANLFVICGSMPTLRKFFKHVAPRIMGSSGAGSTSYYGPQYGNRYGGGAANSRSGTGVLGSKSGGGGADSRAPRVKSRRLYEQFPEEAELHTFHQRGGSADSADGKTGGGVDVDGKRSPAAVVVQRRASDEEMGGAGGMIGVAVADVTADMSHQRDDNSDKAILQTRSFTVQYE